MNNRIQLLDLESKTNNIKISDELNDSLKKYKTILNKPIYDYLQALIALDITVFKKSISDETRLTLSELEIYKDIAKYNIYNRTIKLIKKEEANIGPVIVEDKNEFLTIRTAEERIRLFDFNHVENIFGKTVCSDYKSKNIGTITIFKTLSRLDLTDADIDLIEKKFNSIKSTVNPYGPVPCYSYNSSQRLAYDWESKRKQRLKEYKHFLETIEDYKVLSDKQEKEIEVTNYIHNILTKEFELSEDTYDSTKVEVENLDYSRACVKKMDQLELNKTLTKSMPKLLLEDHIRYV